MDNRLRYAIAIATVISTTIAIAALGLTLSGDTSDPRSFNAGASQIDSTNDSQADDRAEPDLVGRLGPRLPYNEDQLACIRQKLGKDRDLRNRVGTDPKPDSPGFGVLVETGEQCVLETTQAEVIATTLEPSLNRALDDEDRECIAGGYSKLTTDQRQQIIGTGIDPGNPNAAKGRATLDSLLKVCGLHRKP